MAANRSEQLLTERQAAEMLALSFTTLATWRCKKRYGLPFVKIGAGRAVRYRLSDVQRFIESGLTFDTTPLPAPKSEQKQAGGE